MRKPADTQHDVHDLIRERWSPRAFDPRPVPAAELRRVFEAARWAASSFNGQPWRFIVARRDDAAEFEKALGCLVEGNRSWARDAAALILTATSRNFERNGKPNRTALHDLGLSVAQLVLQATHLGLVVHQMAGVDLDRVRDTYRIPQGFDPQTAIAIGYPGPAEKLPETLREAESRPRERAPQSDFVYGGSWGQPADW